MCEVSALEVASGFVKGECYTASGSLPTIPALVNDFDAFAIFQIVKTLA